jgi:hypothetical protein
MQTRCANHFQIYFEPINPMDEIVLAMPWSILGVSPFFLDNYIYHVWVRSWWCRMVSVVGK